MINLLDRVEVELAIKEKNHNYFHNYEKYHIDGGLF
jgi:hypothetical protein